MHASHGPSVLFWAARATAGLLLLLWGAFFVAHLGEWFLSAEELPPPHVWFGHALHFLMLLALLLLVLRPAWGSLAVALTTASFFLWIGYDGPASVPLMNFVPVLLVLAAFLTGAARPQPDLRATHERRQASGVG